MNMNQGMLVPENFKRDKLRITKEQLSFEFRYRRERDIFFFLIQIEKILFFLHLMFSLTELSNT